MIKALALVSTVLLLMTLGFSVLGTTPLLVLKHVQPMDSRVIRQVFHYCYRLIAVVAIAACIGNALVDRQGVCLRWRNSDFSTGLASLDSHAHGCFACHHA